MCIYAEIFEKMSSDGLEVSFSIGTDYNQSIFVKHVYISDFKCVSRKLVTPAVCLKLICL